MYKFLLWDIDGTVLDFLVSEAYAIRLLFREYGFGDCSDEMLKEYSKINLKFWEALERNEMPKSKILVERFSEFFRLYNIDTSYAESFNEKYQVTLVDHLEFINHADEMLNEEKGKFTLVAVTNGTKIAQTKKLRNFGLDRVFDKVFISEDVGFEKPSKAYFDFVFKKAGIIDKSQALIIGDSLTSDMEGGNNAGIDTCWYNPAHKPNNRNIGITYEIDDLSRLKEILF